MSDSRFGERQGCEAAGTAESSGQENPPAEQARVRCKPKVKTAESIAASVNAIAIALAQGKTADELALMSAVFVQLSDTLATIATVREICENAQEKQNEKRASD